MITYTNLGEKRYRERSRTVREKKYEEYILCPLFGVSITFTSDLPWAAPVGLLCVNMSTFVMTDKVAQGPKQVDLPILPVLSDFSTIFAHVEMRMLSPNRISSSAYSPRRRAVPRPRLGDGRMSNRDRDRRHHSHTRGLSRRSLPRSYRDEDTYHENEECIMELTDSGAESNDSDFFWDEERTLFSDLMGEMYVTTRIYTRALHSIAQRSQGRRQRRLDGSSIGFTSSCLSRGVR